MILECLSDARKTKMEVLFRAHDVQDQVTLAALEDSDFQSTDVLEKLANILSDHNQQKHRRATHPTMEPQHSTTYGAKYSLEEFQNGALAASGLLSNLAKCYRTLCPSGKLPMADLTIENWKTHIGQCHKNMGDTFVECFESKTNALPASKRRLLNLHRYLDDLVEKEVISDGQAEQIVSKPCETLENVLSFAIAVHNAHTSFPFEKLRGELLQISQLLEYWRNCYTRLCGKQKSFEFENYADWKKAIGKCAVGYRSELPAGPEVEFEKCVADKVHNGQAEESLLRTLKTSYGEYVPGIERMPLRIYEDLLAIVDHLLAVYPFTPKNYGRFGKHYCIADMAEKP